MAVLKAIVDTINAHGGLTGRHLGHLTETFIWIQEEQEIIDTKIKYVPLDEGTALLEEMTAITCKEYLAYVILKEVDEGRFGELKTILVKGHLNSNAL